MARRAWQSAPCASQCAGAHACSVLKCANASRESCGVVGRRDVWCVRRTLVPSTRCRQFVPICRCLGQLSCAAGRRRLTCVDARALNMHSWVVCVSTHRAWLLRSCIPPGVWCKAQPRSKLKAATDVLTVSACVLDDTLAGQMGDNLDPSSREACHLECAPEEGARGRDSWAEHSEASLYHSAQGSFGQSSTASSVFTSAMHMERSMARSKIQRAPLAEENEESGEQHEEGSDGDSFFSASDDGHREEEDLSAPFANTSPPSNQHTASQDAKLPAANLEADSMAGRRSADSMAGRRSEKQEIVSKAIGGNEGAGWRAESAHGVQDAAQGQQQAQGEQDEAAAEQQREQEEWEAAKRAMEESQEEEYRLEQERAAQASVAAAEQAEAEAGEAAREKEEHQEAAVQDADSGASRLPAKLDAASLEGISKKELLVILQEIAMPQVLKDAGLSGNPNNVAKKSSKEKIVHAYEEIFRNVAEVPPATTVVKESGEDDAVEEKNRKEDIMAREEAAAEEKADHANATRLRALEVEEEMLRKQKENEVQERKQKQKEEEERKQKAKEEEEMLRKQKEKEEEEKQQQEEERESQVHIVAADAAAAAVGVRCDDGDVEGARAARVTAEDEWVAAGVCEEIVKERVGSLDQLIEAIVAKLQKQFEEAVAEEARQKEEERFQLEEEERVKREEEERVEREEEAARLRALQEEEEKWRKEKEEEDRMRRQEEEEERVRRDEEEREKREEEERVRREETERAKKEEEEAARLRELEEDQRWQAEEEERIRREKEERDWKEEAERLRRKEEERARIEEEERVRREDEEAAARKAQNEARVAAEQEAVERAERQAHSAEADKAMTLAKDKLAEQDLHGACAARVTAAHEWECAGEDSALWLQALDREIEALTAEVRAAHEAAAAATVAQKEAEAARGKAQEVADVAQLAVVGAGLAGSSDSGARAVPQWPSLSISEGVDSGAHISSDSEDEEESEGMGVAGVDTRQSCLEKSMSEDIFASCQDHPPPMSSTRAHTAQWVEGAMVSVGQMGGVGEAGEMSLPSAGGDSLPVSQSYATSASSLSHSADQMNIDQDPLPPFVLPCGIGEQDSPPAVTRATINPLSMSVAGGLTALHRACQQGDLQSATSLIAARADPSIRDDHWYCALHYVGKCGHAQLIDLIIVDGMAEAESETREGLTALHLAVAHNHYHTVAGLVRLMTQEALNHQDQDGRTALHYACDVDSKAGIAEVLVSAGGDAHGSDFNGLTPIHLARQSGARAVLAALERTQRNSWRGQSMTGSVPCIPLSPLQVDIDQGVWSGAPRAPAGCTPPWRTGAGRAPASPTAPVMNAYRPSSPMMARAGSPAPIIDGGMAGGSGSGGWGNKSYVEEDIVTGRGEVWVARPLDAATPTADNDWGMRTVAMDPHSPQALGRVPTGAMSNMKFPPVSETAPLTSEHLQAPTPAQRQHVQGAPADFSNWEEGAGSMASLLSHGQARAPAGSVMDLTKSVTDDWIVVDSDDEEIVPYHRRVAAGAGAAGTAGVGVEGDAWQERVNQAKGAALQVKMGITNFWKSLGK